MLHFRSYSTGIETTNTFIHYRSSLVNLTRFQTSQNGQNLYPFSDQNDAKTKPLGAAPTYMGYIRGYPPPGPHTQAEKKVTVWQLIKLNGGLSGPQTTGHNQSWARVFLNLVLFLGHRTTSKARNDSTRICSKSLYPLTQNAAWKLVFPFNPKWLKNKVQEKRI